MPTDNISVGDVCVVRTYNSRAQAVLYLSEAFITDDSDSFTLQNGDLVLILEHVAYKDSIGDTVHEYKSLAHGQIGWINSDFVVPLECKVPPEKDMVRP